MSVQRTTVARVIEQILLLAHHAERAVVENDDFHIRLEFGQRRAFLPAHQQAAVAGTADSASLRTRQCASDRRRHAEDQRAEPARRQPATGRASCREREGQSMYTWC